MGGNAVEMAEPGASPGCVVTLCCADHLARDADLLAGRLRTEGFDVSIAAGARARTLLLRAAPAADDRTDLYVVLVPDAREEAVMAKLRRKFPRPGWHGRHVMFAVFDGKHELKEVAGRVRALTGALHRLDERSGSSATMRRLARADETLPAGRWIDDPRMRPSAVSTVSASTPSGSLEAVQAASVAGWKPPGRPVPPPTPHRPQRGRVRRAGIAAFALTVPVAVLVGWMWARRAGADVEPSMSSRHSSAKAHGDSSRGSHDLPPVPEPWAVPSDPATSSSQWWAAPDEAADGSASPVVPTAMKEALARGEVIESDTMFATRPDPAVTVSWGHAARACEDLEVGGLQGWRLPTRREARGLAVAGALPRAPVWTRSSSFEDPDAMWVFEPSRGLVSWLRTEPNAVGVCVMAWDEVVSTSWPTPA